MKVNSGSLFVITIITVTGMVLALITGCETAQKRVEVEEIPARPHTERPLVGVVEFVNDTPVYRLGWGMSKMLVSALLETQRYRVMTREHLDAALEEQGLQAAFMDPATAVQVGRLVGIDYFIVGSVTECGVAPFQVTLPGIGTVTTVKVRVAADVQVISVTTGEIIAAPYAIGEASQPGIRLTGGDLAGLSFGTPGFNTTLVGVATRNAITDLVNKLVKFF